MCTNYLTKSKFILATQCPAKVYYHDRSDIYANNKTENQFLQALAKAGFQVGELAKCYYRKNSPSDLRGLNTEEALIKTKELLQRDHVVIFEAGISFNNLLLRADILVKNGNSIRLIEVKSSTWNSCKDSFFKKDQSGIYADWLDYINDAAFQKHVIQKAYPDFHISTYLGLLDKLAICPTQGLNQKFRITKNENGQVKIVVSDKVSEDDLSVKLIIEKNIDDEINFINQKFKSPNGMSFIEYIDYVALGCLSNEKLTPVLSDLCANCEFRVSSIDVDKKNGYKECWTKMADFTNKDFEKPSVLDIWYYPKKDDLLSQGIYFQSQVEEQDILPKKASTKTTNGLSRSERQLLQIQKSKNNDNTEYLDVDSLRVEIASWTYPLHFIDFETAAPAIPLEKGAQPYQGFAFQFSHHVIFENGDIEHVDQFINTAIGINPNLSFIRALRKSLSTDSGTIFRYHNHENTYLNVILQELVTSHENIEDKAELIEFIQSIAKPVGSSTTKWEPGERCMVDLCMLVELYTFQPATNGKTSIKKVLPAILNSSDYLQKKYSQAIYGGHAQIKSLNFNDEARAWVKMENGQVCDPYSSLPKLFENLDIANEDIDYYFDGDELAEGGSASIAYMYMQFAEMSEYERHNLREGLLRYCELDTLAMVMIVEAWNYKVSSPD